MSHQTLQALIAELRFAIGGHQEGDIAVNYSILIRWADTLAALAGEGEQQKPSTKCNCPADYGKYPGDPNRHNHWCPASPQYVPAVLKLQEAQGRITHLEAEVARLTAELDRMVEARMVLGNELEVKIARLTEINAELCRNHNALLADGAKWQSRAEAAEAERDKWKTAYESLRSDIDIG